ncbi:alpha/beta fold hydrolase [Chloroflexota bacterium]
MKINSADGISIEYQVTGSGEPALVFVHGFCCDKSYWEAQVPYFARQYRMVTIDLAGHGESGTGRQTWSSAAFGSDVVAVIKELNLEKVVLVGHSMGGGVIAEVACQIPERIIGLVGADTFLNVELPVFSLERAETFLAGLRSDFVSAMRQLVVDMFIPGTDPELVEQVVADMSSSPSEVTMGMVRDRSELDRTIARAFDEVKVPIYCIVSDMHAIDIDAARRHAPSFEVTYMENVGHFVMMEDPERFNRFLSEIIVKIMS